MLKEHLRKMMKEQLDDRASWDYDQILESYFSCQLQLNCQQINDKVQNFFFY